jgi:O-antigen chain-terminating methyltransferase
MVNILLVTIPFIVVIIVILMLILKRVFVLDVQIKDMITRISEIQEHMTKRDKEVQDWIDGKDVQIKDMITRISEIQEHMTKRDKEVQDWIDGKDAQLKEIRRSIFEVDNILQSINEDIDKKYWLSNLLTKKIEHGYNKLPDKLQKRDIDYLLFEKKYRGSGGEIKRKQEIFIKYFKGSRNVLDIGCGRGEFLELLTKNGIEAYGIDVNQDMINYCKKKGLKVKKADALTYLNSLKDNSLGGVFMGQVIEHLHSKELIALVRLCYEKLKKNAYFVAETVNPLNLMVAASSFYMDLSHTRPIHPETIKFLLKSTGFEEIEFEFLSPVPEAEKLRRFEIKEGMDEDEKNRYELMNRNIDMLNGILFGYQDYAVIAKK